ncbi:cytochrome P450 71A9-like [Papaver somniferum]|uniref:cytochrome P450 71A9-like n=1 Tax=Papaver somniferum TaxID=3469 RepID=UPI000E6FFAF4|nr:cytochrome P450 71A9-like [Papaver somniferum]
MVVLIFLFLLVVIGEYWREIRKIAVLELLNAKKVLSYRAVREEEVALAINLIRTTSVPINLSDIMLSLMNNVVCRVAFGMKYEAEQKEDGKNKFYSISKEIINLLGGFSTADLFPWMSWIHKLNGLDTRLEKSFRHMDEFYDKVIDEHIKSSKSSLKTGVESMFYYECKKILVGDTFVAGTDTSAATLVWTMTELIKNPTIMKRAQEEVRSFIGFKDMVEETDLHKLSYTKLVIKQAFRLHPPAPLLVPRETREKCTINGYDIPIKITVLINAKAISTDPEYWKNPYEFCPEIFLNSNIDYKGQDFELIPFGVEEEVALVSVFRRKLSSDMKIEEVDMSEAFGLTTHKKVPLCLLADNSK